MTGRARRVGCCAPRVEVRAFWKSFHELVTAAHGKPATARIASRTSSRHRRGRQHPGLSLTITGDSHASENNRLGERAGRVGSHGEPQGGYPFGGKKNIGKAPGVPANRYHPVIGDDSPDTALDSFRLCAEVFPRAVQVWWGANHYAGFLPCSSCWLVWDKETGSSDFADAELAWCSPGRSVRLFRHQWSGMIRASERNEKRVHPTQKPVALAEWVYGLYGEPGHLVLDPFAGSGMSLIAAESTARRWRGLEMSPEYCDVCLARWEQATGKEAVRL